MTRDLTKTHFLESENLFITPRGRSCFVALDRKYRKKGPAKVLANGKPDDGVWAASLCFPPTVDLKPLKDAVNAAAKEAFGATTDFFIPGKSKGLVNPFVNPMKLDEPILLPGPDDEPIDLTGWTVIRPNSYLPAIPVRGPDGVMIDQDERAVEAYSGRWMRVMVRPHAYKNEQTGVKLYLAGVQLLKHDKAVAGSSGSTTTAEAFGAVEDEEDDLLS